MSEIKNIERVKERERKIVISRKNIGNCMRCGKKTTRSVLVGMVGEELDNINHKKG